MYVHVDDLSQWYGRVSEKNDCVGSFSGPRVEFVHSLGCRSACSLGKLWGRRAERCLFIVAAEVERAGVRSMTTVVGGLFGARTEMEVSGLEVGLVVSC